MMSQEVTLHIRCNNTPLSTVHGYTVEPVTIWRWQWLLEQC